MGLGPSSREMKCAVLIPAGGSGVRFGGDVPKQYQLLRGKPIVRHTVERFLASDHVERVVIATPRRDAHWEQLLGDLDGVERVDGGATRQESVANAFGLLGADSELVAIHDAVRPFFTEALLVELLRAAEELGAAVPGVPVRDTIHEVDENSIVTRTMTRESLRAVQTPQCFRYGLLLRSLEAAENDGVSGTDEATLVARLGQRVKVVPGDESNIKITRPADLDLADQNFDEWAAR